MSTKIKKITVIEDDEILLKAINIELLSSGFEVFSATNGEAGLELIKSKKPDLIILDLVMPKMDGFEVLKLLQNNKKLDKIPVIVLSNLSQKEEVDKAMALGANDFFEKATTNLGNLSDKIKQL